MFRIHAVLPGAVLVALILGSTVGLSQPPNQSSQGGQQPPQATSQQQGTPTPPAPANYRGNFNTDVLAGGSVNELKVPFAPSLLSDLSSVQVKIDWEDVPETGFLARFCPSGALKSLSIQGAASRRESNKAGEHFVGIEIPSPPCWFPMSQRAFIKVQGTIADANNNRRVGETLYEGRAYTTMFWLPLAITLLAVGLIYPGSALVYWYMRQQKHERDKAAQPAEGEKRTPPPTILESLDPVQITANPWGRGSLGNLQIFLFTLIVFALLLFFQLRSGVLAEMSSDVMWLLGISAVGAMGGNLVLTRNRRLSFENWSWLIRSGWMPKKGRRDVAPRAKWSELFVDSDSDEFDLYSFQMAVFSFVVAVALAQTSLTGLGTFKIPEQLLYLLGLSQTLFVGGQAIGTSPYKELNDKLNEVRRHEQTAAALDKKTDAKPEEIAAAKNALAESKAQAAQMFAELYRRQLPDGIHKVVDKAINKQA